LNNVPGARLRITTLRAAEGPAIELLEYLAPLDGRPYPPDTMENDLVRWHTLLWTADAESAAAKLGVSPGAHARSGVVSMSDASRSLRRGFTTVDPDGHGVELRAQ
jgi:hypothetical protein